MELKSVHGTPNIHESHPWRLFGVRKISKTQFPYLQCHYRTLKRGFLSSAEQVPSRCAITQAVPRSRRQAASFPSDTFSKLLKLIDNLGHSTSAAVSKEKPGRGRLLRHNSSYPNHPQQLCTGAGRWVVGETGGEIAGHNTTTSCITQGMPSAVSTDLD